MILLVEDDEDDVFLMEWAMQKVPHAPPMQRVCNGREAIEYLDGQGKFADRTRHPLPALILLDLKLPYVHGFEVLAWIRRQPLYNDIYVATLTSSLEDIDRQKAMSQGANAFYIKPPTPGVLDKLFSSIPALHFRSSYPADR